MDITKVTLGLGCSRACKQPSGSGAPFPKGTQRETKDSRERQAGRAGSRRGPGRVGQAQPKPGAVCSQGEGRGLQGGAGQWWLCCLVGCRGF